MASLFYPRIGELAANYAVTTFFCEACYVDSGATATQPQQICSRGTQKLMLRMDEIHFAWNDSAVNANKQWFQGAGFHPSTASSWPRSANWRFWRRPADLGRHGVCILLKAFNFRKVYRHQGCTNDLLHVCARMRFLQAWLFAKTCTRLGKQTDLKVAPKHVCVCVCVFVSVSLQNSPNSPTAHSPTVP